MLYRSRFLGLSVLFLPVVGAVALGDGCSSSSPEAVVDSGPQVDTGVLQDTGSRADRESHKDTGTQSDTGVDSEAGLDVSNVEAATDTGSDTDASPDTGSDAGHDTGSDSGCSGTTPVAIKVVNYLGWCNIDVGTTTITGAPPTTSTTLVCVAAGATLTAEAASAHFEVGTAPLPWITGVDTGSIVNTSTMSTATLGTAETCVVACCPFSATSGHDAGSGCTGAPTTCD
jgi:hypothetical protein